MTTLRRTRRPRRGFTILELVIALAIGGIVVLVAFGAVSVATDAATRLRGAQRTSLGSLSARATLEGWLRAATVAPGTAPFVGVRSTGLDRRDDEVAFAVLDGGPLYPGPRHIHLRLDDDPDTPARGLVAELRPLRGGTVDTLQVAAEAEGLALRYRAAAAGRSRWQDAWRSDRELPAAVELRLQLASRDGAASPLLALPLVVAVGWGAP